MSAREPYVPDPRWVARRVRETRAEQGLPETVEDPLVYERVAASLGPWLDEQAVKAKQAVKEQRRARRPAA